MTRNALRTAKPAIQLAAWTFVAMVVVYTAVGTEGALYGNPLACLGVGLIGLGLLLDARGRRQPQPVKVRRGAPAGD